MTLRYLGPLDPGTMGPWDPWTLGPWASWTLGPWDSWTLRLLDQSFEIDLGPGPKLENLPLFTDIKNI